MFCNYSENKNFQKIEHLRYHLQKCTSLNLDYGILSKCEIYVIFILLQSTNSG